VAIGFTNAASWAIGTTADPSTTFTPSAEAKAIVVLVITNTVQDQIDGCTIGGVAASELEASPLLADQGEAATIHAYMRTGTFPASTGVAVALDTNATTAKQATIFGLSAGAGETVAVEDVATLNTASAANPAVTLNTSVTTRVLYAIHSGHGATSGITPSASYADDYEFDFGQQVCGFRHSTSSIGANPTLTVTETATAEDAHIWAGAFKAVATLTAVGDQVGLVWDARAAVGDTSQLVWDVRAFLQRLVDAFPGSSLDTSKWTQASGTTTVASGKATLDAATTYTTQTSAHRHDARGSHVLAEFEMPTGTSTGSLQAGFRVDLSGTTGSSSDYVQIMRQGVGSLQVQKREGAVTTHTESIAYSQTDHRWLRIRFDASQVHFETSPDGGTWSEPFTATSLPSWDLGDVVVHVFAGYFNAGHPDPGFMTLDNVNLPPLTAVGDEVALVWDARAALGDTSQLVWDTRAVLGDPLGLVWNARAALGDALEALWDTRAAVGDPLQALWDTRAALGDALQALWDTRAALGDALQALWQTSALAGQQRQLLWDTRAAAGDQLQALWAVRAAVGDSSQLVWHVLSLAGAVGDEVALLWDARALAGDPLQLVWNARAPAADSLALAWDVRAPTTDQLQAVWDARAVAGDQVAALWQVTTTVGDQLGLAWVLRAAAGDQLGLVWDTLAAVGVVGDQLALVWDTRAPAGQQVQPLWAVRALAADQLALEWVLRALAAQQTQAQWATLALAGGQLALAWQLLGAAGGQLALAWTLRALASDQLALVWDTQSLAPLTVIRVAGREPGQGLVGPEGNGPLAGRVPNGQPLAGRRGRLRLDGSRPSAPLQGREAGR
jgi:hypothetical protein